MARKKIGAFNEDFDLRLFSVIARKNAIWLALFILVSFSIAFVYIRYTAPLFEAYTVLKLSDDENQTINVLGQRNFNQSDNATKLAGAIELYPFSGFGPTRGEFNGYRYKLFLKGKGS